MTLLVLALTTILMLLAVLHIAWGIGFWFPLRDEAALARAVIGTPGRQDMPGAVACSLGASALMAAASFLWWAPGLPRDFALALTGAILAGRGVAAWLPAWRRRYPEEPFATLDRRLFGPLCLALGAGFWWLAV
ncbi:DUF3995 domain-containing protein [Defluviimonas sp. WL0024]|uniref:DUF3995 domain-containing protein n=2 Tax=Albidovulum TaxID=205889 RepID=A0ABT3J502_9RHOB|nr:MULTISPECIES: DUF3995 domain-containing protein [Defluviimonas]MCU9849126.1 DUF3995 domain-containing protein [Defluviimonas sp. WL0024]MCW3782748.1 DUF3995 domain-containing protein [Defluviimonas salinarum]